MPEDRRSRSPSPHPATTALEARCQVRDSGAARSNIATARLDAETIGNEDDRKPKRWGRWSSPPRLWWKGIDGGREGNGHSRKNEHENVRYDVEETERY